MNNQEIISQGPDVLEKKPVRELTVHIDQLAYIFRFDCHSLFCFLIYPMDILKFQIKKFRYVNHPEAVADAIQRLWPILKAIFDL